MPNLKTVKQPGIIAKIMTLADGSVRYFFDVPAENVPDDAIKWKHKEAVLIRVYGEEDET